MRVSGGDLCTLVQKHRPSQEARRWVQLVALGGIRKTARTSSPCRFWRFPSFAQGSELCKAQETRGSKFTCEFGRNSTVYCFVASGNKVQHSFAKYEIYLTFSKSLSTIYQPYRMIKSARCFVLSLLFVVNLNYILFPC